MTRKVACKVVRSVPLGKTGGGGVVTNGSDRVRSVWYGRLGCPASGRSVLYSERLGLTELPVAGVRCGCLLDRCA